NQAEGVIGRLSDLNPFFPSGDALGERSQLSQGPTQVDTGQHGGEARHTEALSNQVAFEACHVPPEEVNYATVVPPIVVDGAHVVICRNWKADIPEGGRERESTLPVFNGTVKVAVPEVLGHID